MIQHVRRQKSIKLRSSVFLISIQSSTKQNQDYHPCNRLRLITYLSLPVG